MADRAGGRLRSSIDVGKAVTSGDQVNSGGSPPGATPAAGVAELRDEIFKRVANPALHWLFDYWVSRHREGRLPARSALDPVDMKALLGSMLLIDVLREPLRFRYRLVGTNLVERTKVDLTGKMVAEHPDPSFRDVILGVYAQVTSTARPYAVMRNIIMDDRLRHYQALHLPLADDGAVVDTILVAIMFDNP